MKRTGILFFLIYPSLLFAQKDSIQLPSLKIFACASFDAVRGWQSKQGSLYPRDWGDEEGPEDYSWGFHYGLIVSKKIFSSSFYVATGCGWSSYDFNSFRTSFAPDLRYNHTSVTDVAYSGFELKSMHVPVYFQIPLKARHNLFAFHAGVINDFTTSESYNIIFTEYIYGTSPKTSMKSVHHPGTDFTGMRLQLGLELEIHSSDSRLIPMFAFNITTSPVTKEETDNNFLRYTALYSATVGLGFGAGKK